MSLSNNSTILNNILTKVNNLPSAGVSLNFKIVGGDTKPTNAEENTIWINTTTPISSWEFSATQPSAVSGRVWISTDTFSPVEFNALKENSIQVYPISASQYVSGVWVNKDIQLYQNNEWYIPSIIPKFTYTGDYMIVNDANEPITASIDNWKIRFLTSGTLTFTALNGAESGIDVFLVGGGGGAGSGPYGYSGGGGGYTETNKDVQVNIGTQIDVIVGAGGGKDTNGGDSYFGSLKVSGGKCGSNGNGGSGGSGGGCYYTKGASNGGTAANQTHHTGTYYGGQGQGTTTREFGESNGIMYAGGGSCMNSSGSYPQVEGGGGAAISGGNCNGTVNTGGGGGAGGYTYGSGGSGIVIIRNARG